MRIETIEPLVSSVREAGLMALDEQNRMSYADRGYKSDNSIITTVDPIVEAYLVERIAAHFPEANVLAEEKVRHYDGAKPYTFCLDPIDGTDAFSQSMAGWCTSLALLDETLMPVAGIIYAPKLDVMLFADLGRPATLNGEAVPLEERDAPLSGQSNIMVTSSIHRQMDLRRFPGKIRSIGSAALHLAGPLIYPGVIAGIDGGKGYIWDVAGAHAVIRSVGYAFEHVSGREVTYAEMVKGRPVGELILAGAASRIRELRECIEAIGG